jgi:hypothetical protein
MSDVDKSQLGDKARAFYNRRSDMSNFVISWAGEPKNDFGLFAKGYISAAERLASDLLQAPRFSDYQSYPVVFLYRHALELSLKHVIYRCAELGALRYVDEIADELYNYHRLPDLMKTAAKSLNLLFPGDILLATLIPKCRETCIELASIDPESFAFRYPMDRRGNYATKPHLVLNLSSFAEHMSELLEDLDTVRFALNGEIDMAEDALHLTIRRSLIGIGEV